MRHVGTIPFETPRLLCRPFLREDWRDAMKNWAADPRIQPEYGEPVYPTEELVRGLVEEYVRRYAFPDAYRWAIVRREDGQCIGQIAFCRVWDDCRAAEIEYCVGADFWGRGYAGEALAGLIDLAFRETDFDRLEAFHRAENRKSGRVLEKSVMRRTDSVERFSREGGTPPGEVCYRVTKEEYRGR